MLSVNQISISNEKTTLLDRVSFQITRGETVGIVGASGSGKSLLAHALFDVIPEGFSRDGEINIEGGIALIPQSGISLNPSRWVGKQILRRKDALIDDPEKIIAPLNLNADILNRYPGQLSGGMVKRALTAMAMIQNKRFIIADEPTSGLDSGRSKSMLEQLSALAKEDKHGVVIISHDIVALSEHVDRLVVFNDGKVVDNTSPAEVRAGKCAAYTSELWLAAPENWEWESDVKTA